MSNAAAGSIIGKQGANITELQNKSAARLQLSRSSEFFPGTRDRVLICSGSVDQVVAALKLVITAVDTELVSSLPMIALGLFVNSSHSKTSASVSQGAHNGLGYVLA